MHGRLDASGGMQAYPGGIVAGTAGGAVTVLQQAGHGGASSYCGGGGWLTVAEAAADGAVARLATDPNLEHALVSTSACSLWCGPHPGERPRLHCRLLPLVPTQLWSTLSSPLPPAPPNGPPAGALCGCCV